MSADVLRRAAALMRERAEAATTGDGETLSRRWVTDDRHDVYQAGRFAVWAEDEGTVIASGLDRFSAAHIASWHPAVALAVADWLESIAARVRGEGPPVWSAERHALAVARAYLGEQP